MDINEQLQPVIASLIDGLRVSIESELRDKVSEEVLKKIAETEINSIIESLIAKQIADRVAKFDFVNASREQLTLIVAQLTDQIQKTLAQEANTQINSYITQRLAQVDLNSLISSLIGNKLANMLDSRNFPPQSIPQTAIDFNGLILTGDHIKGGIIERFGSTGIEDLSTGVQMTLMDHATAFEGPVWAPEVKVKGNVTVAGKLTIGEIDSTTTAFAQFVEAASVAVKGKLDTELFASYSDIIFDKIRTEGIELDRITQGGKEIVKGNQLGYHIVDTNIQRVGMIRDLQTQGEAYLSSTLYTTKGRVGVNTMDPSAVLSVWDEEVEINVGKRSQDTASISTPRYQTLILGANGNNNLTLNPDGSVEVDTLTIGTVIMTSATTIPNYSGITGQIVWNQAPAPGGAIGWVCVGGHLWAKFGIIE
jgi:hypothetical protein